MLLLAGDLSYANKIQQLWDTFGLLIEPYASQRPWMVTTGDHDVEKIILIHRRSFTAYNTRWLMPFDESGSNSNQYYSFYKAGVHITMLGSYTDFDSNSDQYKWLQADLQKVDRNVTPWVVVIIHAPWYNSNTAHQVDYESIYAKADLEDLIYQNHVDLVISAHTHAYERFVSILL
ncbi:putative Acid phosphatase [Lupinus albus]|uniref:acid phosphatase n=1 Tax=Lupinus albus TaxID=3870 RepID=A0A6A4NFE7_LUPAL|nr:putative Acid phosphatase [Lupinus albus]